MPVEVDRFDPRNGVPGQRISVLGAGFIRGTVVTFWDGVLGVDVEVEDGEALTVIVPEGATTGIVKASNRNGEGRSSASFIVDDPGPVRVTRFQPTYGQTGEQIKIYGRGFTGGRSVKFGVYQSTAVRWIDDESLIATVPNNAKKGKVKIEVQSAQGVGRSLTDFQIE